MSRRRGLLFDGTTEVTAAPTQAMAAFFDPEALAIWWNAAGSVTTPRPLGIYAIEWDPTRLSDDVLGPLGGAFYGTVMEFHHGRAFLVANAYWLPPHSEAMGPMALEVSCHVVGPCTEVRVRQTSSGVGERWSRYGELVTAGWTESLQALKVYLEQGAEPRLPARGIDPMSR